MARAPVDADDRTLVERRDPLIGAILDERFRIEHQLAAGGFGAIYRAVDLSSDAEVALKVLRPGMTRDPSVVARFRREGKALATLRDPHTITAYELGEADDGTLYIVMELLRGESLYQRYRRVGRLPWRDVVHIALGVCSSLLEAHATGIIHRDLKPANIHLEDVDGDRNFVKVLDFGIAKIVHGNGIDRTELTQAGTMIGTVDYMSPEQMVGGDMTPASDIYTLGVVMFEMIAGRTPFAEAQSATAILAAVLTQAPPSVADSVEVPAALDAILTRCLERDMGQRFATVDDLADALTAVLVAADAGQTPTPMARQKSGPVRAHAMAKSGPVARPAPTATLTPAPSPMTEQTPTPAPLSAETPMPTVATQLRRSGFELGDGTEAETLINVRISDSSEPVLDARGPRRAVGSQHAIDARGWYAVIEGRARRGTAPPPVPGASGMPSPVSGTIASPVPGAVPTPVPGAMAPPTLPTPVPASPPMLRPRSRPPTPPPPGGGSTLPGFAPTPSLPSFTPPMPRTPTPAPSYSYDMSGDAARDTLVRRIILGVVVFAVLLVLWLVLR